MTLPNIDTIDTYGGALVDAAPVEDPTTDRPAAAANKAYASIAAATHTVDRVWVRFKTDGTTPVLASTNASDAVWGNLSGVLPTLGRAGTGAFTLTWPATVTDELGNIVSVNLRAAMAQPEGSTFYRAQATVTAPNQITVYTATATGTPSDIAGTTITVFAK